MSDSTNPYAPPSAVCTLSAEIGDRTHQWNGRTFTVSAHAAAPVLWMDHSISVAIDSAEVHREKALHLDAPFRFKFIHGNRTIDAHVRRGWGFFARRIRYELIIDGELVGKSRAPIDNWKRGVIVMLFGNAVVFAWLALCLLR